MLLDELGAALEDLGHCEEKNSVSSQHTSVNICPVFTESFQVKNTMSSFLKSECRVIKASAQGLFGQEAVGSEGLWRSVGENI